MKNIRRYAPLAVSLFFAVTVSAHAQSGCTDSPEASTDVLMLVGTVGMVHGSTLLKKLVKRLRNR